MDDKEIVELYWSRDEDAVRESIQKYGSYCLSIVHHILRSREDAEERLNDTWVKARGAIPPNRPANLITPAII